MAITLANQQLPDPSSYRVESGYRGTGAQMWDGSTHFDVVQTNVKRKFRIGYVALTTADREKLETAWENMKISAVQFRDFGYDPGPPIVGQYQVTRSIDAPNLEFDAVKTSLGLRWGVTIILDEV